MESLLEEDQVASVSYETKVYDLMKEARLVVWQAGTDGGTLWELRQAREIDEPLRGLSEVVNRADVGVVDASRVRRFAVEPRDRLGVVGHRLGHDLDGAVAVLRLERLASSPRLVSGLRVCRHIPLHQIPTYPWQGKSRARRWRIQTNQQIRGLPMG